MQKTDHSSRKPRLLIINTTGEIGGMERIAVTLARQFVLRGWAVRLVFPQLQHHPSLLAWCREQGVSAETHPSILPVTVPHTYRDILALRHFVRACKPDIVNLHYGNSFISLKDVLAVRLGGERRCVVSVHHPTPWDSLGKRKPLMTRLAAQLSHAVVVNSHAMQAILRAAGVPARKLHHVPCGIRQPTHLPSRSEARVRLGLPPRAFVISSLCRLEPHKGIADLIDAAALIPDPHEDLRVVIGGDGPERATLQEHALARLGCRAVFLGRVSDTADLYAAADVFALPSYMEGFGLVYIEAALHGVPGIGCEVGGLPEAILDEKTGLLVPPGDIPALAVAIRQLRDNRILRRRIGDTARAYAQINFTDTRMADNYAPVLVGAATRLL